LSDIIKDMIYMGKYYLVCSYVQVENPTIFPGSYVTGVVNIEAYNPIDEMGLYLHLTGKEFTHDKSLTPKLQLILMAILLRRRAL
jgi:hypothetical protein